MYLDIVGGWKKYEMGGVMASMSLHGMSLSSDESGKKSVRV